MNFDPGRLEHLAKLRDTKRAVARAKNEEYQSLREELTSARRRAQLTRLNAENANAAFRDEGLSAAARIEGEAETIRTRMVPLQREIDILGSEAAESARLVAACIRFAVAEKLEIPEALRREAASIDMMGAH